MEKLFRAIETFCLGAIAYATTGMYAAPGGLPEVVELAAVAVMFLAPLVFLVVALADPGKIVNERYPEDREPAQR